MMKNVKKVKKTKKSKDIDKILSRELRSIMIETKNSPEKKSSTRLLLEMRYGK
ncbi:hypothetical protein J7J60_01110 [bacterium]|nr:hypothetical protein [bacterium]